MSLQPTRSERGSQRFRASDRVRESRDFQRSRARGKRAAARGFGIEITRTLGPTRLGLVVSRKVGGAVVRNRVKRLVREWFRRSRDELPRDVDVVVIARPAAAEMPAAEIWAELARLATRGAK